MAKPDGTREVYASIIGYLPEDAQRVVNNYLPELESLVDEETTAFGKALADSLVERAGGVFCEGKGVIKERISHVRKKGEKIRKEFESHAEQITGAAGTVRQQLDSLTDLIEDDGKLARRVALVDALHSDISQLRMDCARGRTGDGVHEFKDRFNQWKKGLSSKLGDSPDWSEFESTVQELTHVVERDKVEGETDSIAELVDRLKAGVAAAKDLAGDLKERIGSEQARREVPQLPLGELALTIHEAVRQLDGIAQRYGEEANTVWPSDEVADGLLAAAASTSRTLHRLREGLLPDAGRQTEEWILGMRQASDAAPEDARATGDERDSAVDPAAQAVQDIENLQASYGALKRFVDDWATFNARMQEAGERVGEVSAALEGMDEPLGEVGRTGEAWSSHMRIQADLEPLLSRLEGQVRELAGRLREGSGARHGEGSPEDPEFSQNASRCLGRWGAHG